MFIPLPEFLSHRGGREEKPVSKFLFSLGVIAFGLFLGYAVQVFVGRGILPLPMEMERLRKLILKSALVTLLPVTVIGAVWSIQITDPRIATLPFLGGVALSVGGMFALVISRMLRLGRSQTGSLFVCGSFTNLGAIGGLICYVFLGETGFGFVPIYRLFEEFLYYLVGFPVARLYGSEVKEEEPFSDRLRNLTLDPLIRVSVSSLLIGGILNLSGLKRPDLYQAVNSLLIPVTSIVFLVPLGMVMKVRRVRHYFRECMLVALIKFLIVPGVVTPLALFLGYRHIAGGLPLKVVIILSSMPVAFLALIPPSLFDLDVDLANSCWLFTTSMLVIILPVLYFVIRLF
jgi:predicted permease